MMACSLTALAISKNIGIIWLGVIMFALGFSSSFGQIMYAHIKELVPSELTATAMTAVNFFTMIGGAVFLHGFGFILSMGALIGMTASTQYSVGFFICSFMVFMGAILYRNTRDSSLDPNN
jgi:hypothetical protein